MIKIIVTFFDITNLPKYSLFSHQNKHINTKKRQELEILKTFNIWHWINYLNFELRNILCKLVIILIKTREVWNSYLLVLQRKYVENSYSMITSVFLPRSNIFLAMSVALSGLEILTPRLRRLSAPYDKNIYVELWSVVGISMDMSSGFRNFKIIRPTMKSIYRDTKHNQLTNYEFVRRVFYHLILDTVLARSNIIYEYYRNILQELLALL